MGVLCGAEKWLDLLKAICYRSPSRKRNKNGNIDEYT
jgi:hypothetical protein